MSDYNLNLQSAPPPEENPIVLDWYPDIEIRPLYDAYRVPAELSAVLVRELLKTSIARCLDALATFKAAALLAGAASLEDVDADSIDGEHKYTILWRRAVYCYAMAEVLKSSQLIARRKDAENAAKTSPETADTYREYAQDALNQIATGNLATVEIL